MSKNKVAQGKMLATLHYSPNWLREQTPYSIKIDQPVYLDIDEDDIPF